MDKATRTMIRGQLNEHYKQDRLKRDLIKIFTNNPPEPVSLEAFKKHLLKRFKIK
jgi:hypothetical protein